MDNLQCGLLKLPLELRHQIYIACFGSSSKPNLLYVNRSINREVTHFLRRWQQTYTFHISGNGAGFDAFSQFCFKIKGHIPRFSRMRHIVLKIHSPDLERPIQMWYIWQEALRFCKDLAYYRKIRNLTLDFVDDDFTWATNGLAHSTMNLPIKQWDFCYSDVGQILAIFCRFMDNVENSKVVLPQSYLSSTYQRTSYIQKDAEHTESLMTGRWTGWVDKNWIDDFWLLNEQVDIGCHLVERATGRKSKAVFEKVFGRTVVLRWEDWESFKQQWTHMETLDESERPRERQACPTVMDCVCEGSLVEIALPDPSLLTSWEAGRKWQKELVGIEDNNYCALFSMRQYDRQPEKSRPCWRHGEELQRCLFPQRELPDYRGKYKLKKKT